MPLIDLIRHGETETPGLLLGRTDSALSETGWRQFERQTAHRTWTSIVSSPLRRSREAAERLARSRNLPLRIDCDWAELDFGHWDGRTVAELRADSATAAALDAFYRDPKAPGPPDGESWHMLCARIARALDRVLEEAADGTVLVVTHGGAMRAAIAHACAFPLAQTWALRIDPATRITLRVGRESARIWGEIVEVVQP